MSETAHIRRALTGDDAALETLIRRLLPVIRARASWRIRRSAPSTDRIGTHDIDDLAQEVWIALLRNDGRQLLAFDADRGMTLEGYVGLIAEREIGNLRQKSKTKKRGGNLRLVTEDAVSKPSFEPSPEAVVVGQDLAVRLGAHLDEQLPQRGRLVLKLAFADGCPPTQVAELMGVSLQVVYNWQHKIRALSRTFLA